MPGGFFLSCLDSFFSLGVKGVSIYIYDIDSCFPLDVNALSMCDFAHA